MSSWRFAFVQAPSKEPIAGVFVTATPAIVDERGWLMEILRNDRAPFTEFGQVYCSATFPGAVKAWHFHERQTDHFVCVAGLVKLVLVDTREESRTRGVVNEFFLGPSTPKLVQVPCGVYHGWKGVSAETALVINVPDRVYDYGAPDEQRVAPHGVLPYDWGRVDG